MEQYTSEDARKKWRRILNEVESGGQVGITRYGKPLAVVTPASGDRQSEWEEQPVKIRQKTSTDIAYEAGYSDGANSAIADVQIQFIDPLDGMDGLLEFFRGLIGDPDLAWPERAAKEET